MNKEFMKLKILLAIFLLSLNNLSALFEGHLKPCSGKSEIHHMRNIDFIYIINLDQRPEKLKSCTDQLHPFGIYPYRFSAVNGWELTLSDINDLGVTYQPGMDSSIMGTCYLAANNGKPHHEMINVPNRIYFSHCMAPGPMGIALSHLSILQDAYNSGYETIWVMEDDIFVAKDPTTLPDLIDRLDLLVGHDNWDILFTDPDTKNNDGIYVPCASFAKRPNFSPSNPGKFSLKYVVSPDFRKVGARYGAYSMIVRRSGMKKILDFFKAYQIFLPFDMEYTLPDIHLYTLNYDLVATQINALSDNGKPNCKDKKN
jgi:GR25 family glycosyltransferase involved in LPS biosynthesis